MFEFSPYCLVVDQMELDEKLILRICGQLNKPSKHLVHFAVLIYGISLRHFDVLMDIFCSSTPKR